jgi:hypothetical protein
MLTIYACTIYDTSLSQVALRRPLKFSRITYYGCHSVLSLQICPVDSYARTIHDASLSRITLMAHCAYVLSLLFCYG